MTSKSWATVVLLGGVLAAGAFFNRAALRAPLALDDFAQRAMIEGTLTPHRGPFSLFDFVDDINRATLLDRGALPWWTDPRLTIRFLRPLSSALTWIDYGLFGYGAFYPHVHSFLWWALAVVALHALLRQTLPKVPALLGTVAFGLSSSHTIPLIWLANRDVLVALALGALALAKYLRWRERQSTRDGLVALLLFAAALLSGEYALCFAGYIVAWEAVTRHEPLGRRAIGVTPFALPALAYTIAHVLGHFGARASGFYRNPVHDPVGYLRGAPRALIVLLGSAWFGIDDVWWATAAWGALALLGVGTIAVLGLLFWYLFRSLDVSERRMVTFLLLGSTLALVPVLAAEPSTRLLGIGMLGVSGAVGLALDGAWRVLRGRPRSPAAIVAVVVSVLLGYAHFVRGPSYALGVSQLAADAEQEFDRRLDWLRQHLDRSKSTVVIVRASSPPAVLWTPFMLRDAAPARWRVLSQSSDRSVVVRTGPRSVDVRAGEEPLFPTGPRDLLRVDDLASGQSTQLSGMRATLMDADEQRAKQAHFEFDVDLEDPSIEWLVEGVDGFHTLNLPAAGYGVRLRP
jgi:hypothetical protein